ncbi:NTP transferase domain-containing protein [Lysobacter sp. LF1]|uniref:NTP transferase domain-containing protein n=1 Tax=Lysobacter stagni TaxID=3045172 RepID=A0ABT6XE96_9GAMM|nr:NTP transferase domain-containing protein [Lysobacter sp. LF1]MDI9238469.1 NTP transferase domain-containing protein [Lysobacter sp. LF1]
MTGHAALVLAAGGSRRLGQSKQLLTRNGETLVHRAVRLAVDSGAARVILVTGAFAHEVSAAVHDLASRTACGVRVVFNAAWPDGLASSLAAADALHGFEGPILVLVTDQPALEISHLQRLLAGAASVPSHCAATRHGERVGVPAVVTASMLAQAKHRRGDSGLGAQLSAMRDVWTLEAPELAHDIDTPADVAAAVSKGWLDT